MDPIAIKKSETPTQLSLTAYRRPSTLAKANFLFSAMQITYKILFMVSLSIFLFSYVPGHFPRSFSKQNSNELSLMLLVMSSISFVCQHMLGSKIVKEDCTVIQDFGIQMYSYNLRGSVCGSKFVDLARVREVILNESMTYWQLDQYVAFICEREDKLIVPFSNTRIRQKDLIGVLCTLKQFIIKTN